MPRNLVERRLSNDLTDPGLDNPDWRAFILEKEANSALAASDWLRYRRGLRRLMRIHAHRIPQPSLLRALAEDVFFCATHWKQGRLVVRGALREFLRHPQGESRYMFAAVEYLKWASSCSVRDVPEAKRMISVARSAIEHSDVITRANLEKMIKTETTKLTHHGL